MENWGLVTYKMGLIYNNPEVRAHRTDLIFVSGRRVRRVLSKSFLRVSMLMSHLFLLMNLLINGLEILSRVHGGMRFGSMKVSLILEVI